MKNKYVEPEFNLVEVDNDVVTTSDATDLPGDNPGVNPFTK